MSRNAFWLMKSEPSAFSIDDLERRGREPWDGVRNYQARNFMRDAMHPGDRVFFYHSNCAEPGIVGIAEIASDAYPDPTQFDPEAAHFDAAASRANPRWVLVDVAFVRRLKRPIGLDELKRQAALADMQLLRRGNRLSVLPVEPAHWRAILALEKTTPPAPSPSATGTTDGPSKRKTGSRARRPALRRG